MSGLASAVGVLVTTCTLLTGALLVGEAGVLSQRAAGAADAAALAAADTVTGLLTGDACARAAEIAAANAASLDSCHIDGAVATVAVRTSGGALSATAVARAGPPP